ncbi:MAG: hypothetical protein ACFFCM_08675 [Promethearchaeota archaeon]
MKDWVKLLSIIIGIIINVFLVIGGIYTIIVANRGQNELAFITVFSYFEKLKDFVILLILYTGSRPYFMTYLAGIVLLVIGFIGFFIIIGKNHSYFSSKLNDVQKSIIRLILIIFCIIFIMIGAFNFFSIQRNQFNITAISMISLIFNNESLLQFIILYGALNPYSSTSIIGLLMIIIGIGGLFFQGILYKSSKISSGMVGYKYSIPASREFEPIATYTRRSVKKIRIKKCPACHAPLRKSPPCECEYCGTILE